MNRSDIAVGIAATSACLTLLGWTGAANASTPTGTCTNSYQPYDEQSLVAIDPAAGPIFSAIDTNADGIICFKPYQNGAHAGHAGNLVDDKAAPHS